MSKLTPKQVSERCTAYFKSEIDNKEFALYMRRFLHVSATTALERQDIGQQADWVRDGYFYLHDFLEQIDPKLDE